MFDALKTLFATSAPEADADTSAQLAAAALMVEISRADRNVDDSERASMRAAIEQVFDIDTRQVDALLDEAQARAEDSTSLYEFTRVVNNACDDDEKYALMLSLWRVALADGDVDRYESHLLRRIADLIHMRHRHYIRAKLEAGA